jgi:integrase
MGAKAPRIPGYLLHKASGQARIRIRGRDYYLGKYNSPESREHYHKLVAQYIAEADAVLQVVDCDQTSVAELVAQYVEFAKQHYRHNPDERYRIKAAITPLVEFYGALPVEEFSPKKLKAVRQQIIDRRNAITGKPLSRKYVNQLTGLIKKIFKWGVSEELAPVTVFQALDTLPGLRKGRTEGVAESRPVKPVPEEHVTAILSHLQPEIATMVQVQWLTGMRPDETTILKPKFIERTGDIWIYTIPSRFEDDSDSGGSKTDWLENVDKKEILLGPQAQKLLSPWLVDRLPEEYLFSPQRVCKRLGVKPGKRQPRDHYDDESYCQAVQRACRRAGVPEWTPGRLRHNAATRIRHKYGAEAARLVLGHRHLSTTEIYAERDLDRYREIVAELG